MVSSGVKVLGMTYSPFVNRVQIALNLKSVDYEFVEETMSCKSDLLLKSNPVYQKVPVLIHGDKPICESSIIVQYIDEAWNDNGYSILPSDPYDRAVARFWAAYVDDKIVPLMRELRSAQEKDKEALVEQIGERMVFIEEAFAKCSKGKGYFGGDKIGYIDVIFGSCMGWLKVVEQMGGMQVINEVKTPGLFQWSNRFLSNEAVVNVVPKMEKFLELMAKAQTKVKDSSH